MRTEHLVESHPLELDISADEAKALGVVGQGLASDKTWWGDLEPESDEETGQDYRSVIKVTPSATGTWLVNVVDAVGVVALPSIQLVVHPKIPVSHLLFLFAETDRWPSLDESVAQLAAADDLAELVAHWFLNSLERVLRLDLVRDYRSMEDDLDSVRGQIVPLPTAALYYSGRLAAHCQFEEFDVDTPLNRVLRAAANAVAFNPGFSRERTKRALRFLTRMSEVGLLQADDVRVATIDRRTAHCREALVLAKHVLQASGRTLAVGAETVRSFLIRTPEMVEEGLRATLDKALRPAFRVTKQGHQLEGSKMTLNPDLLFLPSGAIGDVKYQINRGEWARSHIYQGVTFATGFGTEHGLVISFTVSAVNPPADVKVGDVTLRSIGWNAQQDAAPEDSALDVCDQVMRWLRSTSVREEATA